MINHLKKKLEQKMNQNVDSFKSKIKGINAGRAFPELLDGIIIDYYGQKKPLFQLSSIIVENPSTLKISAFDCSINKLICKAIIDSNLGFNPSVQGNSIRVLIPHLTEERRKKLIKIVRTDAEKSRVFIRNIRREGNAKLKEYKKNLVISSDQEHKMQIEIQSLTNIYTNKINALVDDKEKQLMTI